MEQSMRNIKRYWLLSLALLPQAFTGMALGAEPVSPTQFLLEQVRLGEATNRDELVKQSLYRLNMMDPNNPDVVAASMRQALRQQIERSLACCSGSIIRRYSGRLTDHSFLR